MEIYRAIHDEWKWDDSYYNGHTIHIEIGYYASREKAEDGLYKYMAQRIPFIDKDKLKKCISKSSPKNHIKRGKYNDYWIEPVTVEE